MCGIFGWAASKARAADRDTLRRLTDLLAHRGPDGSGFFVSDSEYGAHEVAMGHRRLSIIDIDGGTQPMSSEDGRLTLVQNGEIYNYLELREELVARGHRFRTSSDTEVLIEAWRAYGADALPRLRGMFAFALWDSGTQTLVLARDPFGKKPLFLHEQKGLLLFSSEIDPILNFPGVPRQLEHGAIEEYVLYRYVPGPATFFRSIRKLEPGSFAVWKNGTLSFTRYFRPPVGESAPDILNPGDAADALGRVFDDAVRIRMRSDAPFGAYLSGGLDSSAVVASMVRHAGRVRTFSVGFADPAHSELPYAQSVAARFGTEHHELVVDADSFLEHWPEAVRRRGAPVSEASDIPILMLSKVASDSVKMVLTGEGSDEMLGGYPKHRAEAWVALYQRLVPRAADAAILAPLARALPYRARRMQIFARLLAERSAENRLRAWFASASASERANLLGPDSATTSRVALNGSSPLRRMLYFDQTSWLPDNLLERGDRMMMAGGIEGRMPFMDVELAAVAARISDRLLVGGRGGKRVLRDVLRKTLPEEILNRRKIGFRVPFHDWFRTRYRELVRDLLTGDASRVRRMCNAVEIARYVREHLDGRHNHERILWTLVNLEMFLRAFGLEAEELEVPQLASRKSLTESGVPAGR